MNSKIQALVLLGVVATWTPDLWAGPGADTSATFTMGACSHQLTNEIAVRLHPTSVDEVVQEHDVHGRLTNNYYVSNTACPISADPDIREWSDSTGQYEVSVVGDSSCKIKSVIDLRTGRPAVPVNCSGENQ